MLGNSYGVIRAFTNRIGKLDNFGCHTSWVRILLLHMRIQPAGAKALWELCTTTVEVPLFSLVKNGLRIAGTQKRKLPA